MNSGEGVLHKSGNLLATKDEVSKRWNENSAERTGDDGIFETWVLVENDKKSGESKIDLRERKDLQKKEKSSNAKHLKPEDGSVDGAESETVESASEAPQKGI